MRKIFTLLLVLCSLFSFSQSTTLVISQVYGAGGNTGASLNADYVELHNISSTAQSTAGFSIQYSSATNTGTWTGVSPLPAASIPAGGYYLIQTGGAGANGSPLPTADYLANPTIALSGTNGKVALVNGTTALSGCPTPGSVIDLVGYGSANCFEGGTATAVLTVTTAATRKNNGCTETDNNGSDFDVITAVPRNSASPVFVCGGGPPSPSITAGTVVDFGNVTILTNSTSQSFNITGANLTGAPGNITVTAPSVDFQVSNNNSTWGASTTIAYTSATLASTPVWVRFTPQTTGLKTGNVNIIGGGVTNAVTVAVSGNGTAAVGPTVSATPTDFPAFGAVCLNTTAGPNFVTISGTDLTAADLVVGPLAGFTFSTTFGGVYTASLTLPHPAATYTQDIFIKFTPTAVTNYSGVVTVTGGGLVTPANIGVSGSGSGGLATVTTGSASTITQVSATLAGTLPAQGCSPVTSYGFEYSTTTPISGGIIATSTNLSGIDFSAGIAGLLPSTTYYYRAFATNTGGTAYGAELSFITASPPPATLSATALNDFGSTCANSTVGPNSVDISGVDLTTADIVVGPLNGYAFSTTSGGTYTSTLTLTQPGGTYLQTIYVKFTPTTLGSFNGNIPVTGGGVSSFSIPVTGSGFNIGATVVTNNVDPATIKANEVIASGTIAALGCSAVTSYGIEYSGISGFIDGSGVKVESTNLSGTDFSSKLTGLYPNTTYYYKAYAVSNGITDYGLQNTFTTLDIPDGLVIYSTPVIHGQNLHFSLTNKDINNKNALKPGHYSAMIHNSVGQIVFKKDFIVQVNFMDYTFLLPANLPIGIYYLQIGNYEYHVRKAFYVQ
ncbi:MAG: lamin tail domain-containing protein [Ferruginibacter sp.]